MTNWRALEYFTLERERRAALPDPSVNHLIILVDLPPALEPARIPARPHALAFAVTVIPLDRLLAVGVPTDMATVLLSVTIMIERRTLAVRVPHRPLALLHAVAIGPRDHPAAAIVEDDKGAVLDRFAVNRLLAPELFALRRHRPAGAVAGRTGRRRDALATPAPPEPEQDPARHANQPPALHAIVLTTDRAVRRALRRRDSSSTINSSTVPRHGIRGGPGRSA